MHILGWPMTSTRIGSLFGAVLAMLAASASPVWAQAEGTGLLPDTELVEKNYTEIEAILYHTRSIYDLCVYLHRNNTPLPVDDRGLLYLNYDADDEEYTTIIGDTLFTSRERDWQGHPLVEGLTGEVMKQTITRNVLFREDRQATCEASIAVPEELVAATFFYLKREFGVWDKDFSKMGNTFALSRCEEDISERNAGYATHTQFGLEKDAIRISLEGQVDEYCEMEFGQ